MENVEEKILSDTELENYFEETAIGYIVREIKKYPLLSEQEFAVAFTEYKNGSKKAEDLIVNSNLRLVLSVAKRYIRDKKSLQIEDLFQEGTIGLMRALKTYDPDEGKFSTYAFHWIRQAITRAMAEKDDTIRRAYSFTEAKKKYNRLYADCQVKGIPLPSKEEIMRILKISSGIYDLILEDVKKSTLSLNSFIGDDEETELGDFVPVIEDGYKRVNQQIDDHNLLLVLKTALLKHEYYVLYYRVLIGESLKLEELGEKLTLTRERIRQIEEKATKRAEKYITNKNTLYRQKIEELTNKYGKNLEKVKDEPVNVDMIFMYLYLREHLTDVEKNLFKNIYFSDINYTPREILSLMSISKEIYLQTLSSLNKKIKTVREQEEDIFELFKKKIAKKYTTKVFYLDLDSLDFQNILTMGVDEIERENSSVTYKAKTPEQSEETSNEESLDFELNTSDVLPNSLPDSQSVITKEELNPDVLLIIEYLYIKEMLSKYEREVYKLFYLKKKSKEDVISYLSKKGFAADYFDLVILKIKDLTNSYIKRSKKAFDYFINRIVAKYGLEIDIRKIDTLYIKDCFAPPEIYLEALKSYQNYMFADIENLFQEELSTLTEDELNLLKRFYNIFPDIINPTILERELNLTYFGYNPESERVNPKLLLDTYLKNIDSYTAPQRLYLETYVFGLKPKSLFKRAYPEIVNIKYYDFLLERLEAQYFGVYRLFDNSFTKEKWLQIKEKYPHKFSSRKIAMLDLYYGVNEKPKSIKEIATMFSGDYNTIHDELSDARDFACAIYYLGTQTIEYNPKFYIGYIENEKFEMTPETRTVLRLFMIEHKTYEEISKLLNISKTRTSNIITDAIRKMDAYRFGILKEDKISAYKLKKILTFAGDRFSSIEIKIIFARKINGLSVNETAKKYGMSKADINSIITKFNDCILAFNIANVDLTTEDVKKELRTHRSESVLSEKQKMIISYYYGIKNEYNPEGNKYSSGQIQKHFKFNNISTLIRTLKGKKIGLIKPQKIYISRAEMINYLRDPHLPISDKERDIICYLYELEGHELKTIAEIAEIYNEGPSSVNRRYNRAIVNIFKYCNKEIPDQINFKVDVEPFLRYFCVLDANILIDYFRDNLTCEQIADKYGLTYAIIYKKVAHIKMRLLEMRENPNSKKFDFEFYRKNVFNPSLPLHGDIKLSKEIFDLFMAENSPKSYSYDDIVKLLSLNCSSARVRAAIFSLMIASCKLQMGTKKAKSFTREEVLEYYLKHKDNMTAYHLRYYETYFKSELKINSNNSQVHPAIINDLLKSKHKDYIYLAELADDQVKRLFKSKRLTPELINSLLSFYEIPAVTMMSSADLMELYNIFYKLEKAFISNMHLSLQKPMEFNFKDPFMRSVLEESTQRNVLSNSEFDSLFAKMQKGDNKAKQELYNRNIKVLLYILNNFFNGQEEKIKSSFQVALLALQEAINSYDGKTNYLIVIYMKVTKALSKKVRRFDCTIDSRIIIEYQRFLNKHQNKLPSDDLICDILDIDRETLQVLKRDFNYSTKDTFNDTQPSLEEEYLSKQEMTQIKELRIALRVLLKPQDYYLIYYCCLYPNVKSKTEIANLLNIKTSSVGGNLKIILNNLRLTHFKDEKTIAQTLNAIIKKYGSLEFIKEEPIEVEKIIEYIYLEDDLSKQELKLFRMLYFEERFFTYDEICRKLKISLSELRSLIESLNQKIKPLINDPVYVAFANRLTEELNSKIFYIPGKVKIKHQPFAYATAKRILTEVKNEQNGQLLTLKST